MHIPRAICGNDGWEMQIEKTGILVEMFAKWGSYYKVYGDKYHCPECDSSVILPSDTVLVQNHEPNYKMFLPDMQGFFIN